MKDLLTAVSRKSYIGRTLRSVIIAFVIVYVMIMSALLPVSTLYFEARAKEEDTFVGVILANDAYLIEKENIEAAEDKPDDADAATAPTYLKRKQNNSKATRVSENKSARTIYSKEYIMSDGSKTIERFSQPIHYLENHEYKEIDNTLIEKTVSGKTEIENKANSFKAKFRKSDKEDSEVEVIVDKYNFKWTLQMEKEKKEGKGKVDKNGNFGKVKYKNFYQGIDIEYVVKNSQIKEDIILYQKQESNHFFYDIKVKNLNLILQDDGSIDCVDSETYERVMNIPKAYMSDSNKVMSYDISYHLEKKGEGKYTLKVLPNEEWLKADERVYPVTIDPIVNINTNSQGLYSLSDNVEYDYANRVVSSDVWTYIYFPIEGIPKEATILSAVLSFVYIGSNPNGDMMHIYRAFGNWKDHGTTNLKANALGMGNSDNNALAAMVAAVLLMHPMSSTPFESALGAQMNADITNIVRGWQQGAYDNHGIILYTGFNQTSEEDTTGLFFNREEESGTNLNVTINYRTNVGIEDYWSYDHVDAGRAGKGYVNQFNNQMTYVHNTITLGGELPITLSHIYSDAWIDANFDVNGLFANMNVGVGWKLNYQQAILPISIYDPSNTDSRYKFVYIDADGTPHRFWQESEGSSIIDEDGLGYVLTVDTNSLNSYYTLTDVNKGKLKFYNTGRLYRVEDANGNYNEIVYDASYRIVEIVDRVGRKTKLEYLANNYLIKVYYDLEALVEDGVTEVYNKVVQLEYVGATVYKFLYNDGKKTFYSYENGRTGRMTEVYNFDGYSIKFGFSSRTIKGDAVLVRSISERLVTVPENGPFEETVTETSARKLRELQFFIGKTEIVSAKARTYFVEYDAENEDDYYNNNLITNVVFDLEGRAINSYAIINNEVVSNVYYYDGIQTPEAEVILDDNQETTDEIALEEIEGEQASAITKNKLTKFTSFSSEVKNYLLNPSFENGLSHWSKGANPATPKYRIITNSYKKSHGNDALVMMLTQVAQQRLVVAQSVALEEGTYTLSGYIRIGDNLHRYGTESFGAFLEVSYDSTTITTERITSETTNSNGGFRLVSVTFTLSNAGSVVVRNVLENCATFAWFDGLQLIKGATPSYVSYNMLHNGGFDEYTDSGIDYWNIINNSELGNVSIIGEGDNARLEAMNHGNALKISNTVFGGYQAVYEDIYLNASVSKNYVLSAWANTSQTNDGHENAMYGIAVEISETEVYFMPFDKNILNWHQISLPFTISASGIIRIHILYVECIGVALFDNICLTTCDTSSYSYNEYGMLENSTWIDGNTTSINVQDGGTLITRTLSTSTGTIDLEQTLRDTNYNVSYVKNIITGAENSFTYDEYGNMTEDIIKNYTSSTGLQIVSNVDYGTLTEDFQQNIANTNSRGFITISTYDSMLGVLQGSWNTRGDRKYYTYDTSTELLKEISVYKNSNKTDYIKYTYDENYRISKVEYKNVYYRYEYNNWGQVIRVFYHEKNFASTSRNPLLIQNSYNAHDGSITSSKNYLTGYQETYSYDEYGRVIGISTNTNNHSYWYYNGAGQVTKQTSYEGTRLYDYDGIGRLRVTSLKSSSAEVSRLVEEYKYDKYNRVSSKTVYIKEREEEAHPEAYDVLPSSSSLTTTYTAGSEIFRMWNWGIIRVRYDYSAGNLIRENNQWLDTTTHTGGETILYTRDDFGNLLYKTYYPYTTGNVGTAIRVVYPQYVAQTYTFTYQYNDYTSAIKKISLGDGYSQNYGYDELQRVNSKDIIDANGTTIVNEDFTYVAGRTDKENSTTTLVSTKTVNGITFTMSYDYLGRITEIQDSRYTNPLKYYYDYFGSLYRENNPYSNQTILYQTSSAELISGVTYYPYTTSSTLGTAIEEKVFSRGGLEVTGDTANGLTITYNQNTWLPSVYHGVALTWRYGQLQKYGTTIYGYDSISGRRIGKNVNGVVYNYYYDNEGRLYRQKSSVADIWFYYDNAGAIEGIKYNGTNYFYLTNPLGDVIGVIDSSGNVVVTYTYDAWGNILSTSGTLATTLGVNNPIRYRGYYYDEESGFYYLGSRYYDPYYGGFISKDSVESGDLWGYCDNDPVNNVDPTGYWIDTALDVISLTWSVYDLVKDPTWENGAYVALDVAFLALPFVAGAGAGARALKIVSKADDIVGAVRVAGVVDDVSDAVKTANRADAVANGFKLINNSQDTAKITIRALDNSGAITKSTKSAGSKIHKAYFNNINLGKKPNTAFAGTRLRPDFVDIDNRIIYELKPNNQRSIARGEKQLLNYISKAESFYGGVWKGVLDLY